METIIPYLFYGLFSFLLAIPISWIASMEIENHILIKMDNKVTQEMRRWTEIDSEGKLEFKYDVRQIRASVCKKERWLLYLAIYLTSFISIFSGMTFLHNSPSFS